VYNQTVYMRKVDGFPGLLSASGPFHQLS